MATLAVCRSQTLAQAHSVAQLLGARSGGAVEPFHCLTGEAKVEEGEAAADVPFGPGRRPCARALTSSPHPLKVE